MVRHSNIKDYFNIKLTMIDFPSLLSQFHLCILNIVIRMDTRMNEFDTFYEWNSKGNIFVYSAETDVHIISLKRNMSC